MKLTVIGVGYVGLVTGACFAEMGFHVTCLDIDSTKIDALCKGNIPIYEPGLEEIVQRNTLSQRIHFTTDYKEAVETAQAIFLALPTPSTATGECDCTALFQATRCVAKYMHQHKTIIIKSTVPVGTNALVKKILTEEIEKRELHFSFDVVSNPEFLKEGCAVHDFMRPDRVIIGCDNEEAHALLRELYKPFMFSRERIFFMDAASAELTKYAANTMLATRISFMNWLSELAEKTGADITQIRKGIGSDARIGYDFLWAGLGFGGSCLPKDVSALRASCVQHEVATHLLDAVLTINERQKHVLSRKISQYFSCRGGLANKTIGILGLAFKPDTDDMRDASSLALIEDLHAQGCVLQVFDPIAMSNAKAIIGEKENIFFCQSELEAATNAHALVLVTEWKQFRLLDFSDLRTRMTTPVFFDGRNQYTLQEMLYFGFDYISIGREDVYTALSRIDHTSFVGDSAHADHT